MIYKYAANGVHVYLGQYVIGHKTDSLFQQTKILKCAKVQK